MFYLYEIESDLKMVTYYLLIIFLKVGKKKENGYVLF